MRLPIPSILLTRNTRTKLVGYFSTAGIAAIIDAGGFALLQQVHWPIALSASLSFGVAALVNYLLTSRLVFGRRPSPRGFAAFLAGALAGFCVNVGVTVILVTAFGLWPLAAKIIGVGTAFFFNFLINLLILFKPQSPPE